ncbi:geranylgeranyl reductase family protein [Cyclobacteriaceae bacterium YHN15]|nr:geranylgeranyl reductase family protein [Cyclobacteriaceae bacterium YHN15]
MEIFDVVIIGAGPAGATAAWHLSDKGLNIALLDKKCFPRDKICGDAWSGNTIFELKKLEEKGLDLSFFEEKEKVFPANGLSFFSPKGYKLDLVFSDSIAGFDKKFSTSGYVSKRIDFDDYLLSPLRDRKNISVIEKCEVKQVNFQKGKVDVVCKDRIISTSLVIGADGANSILAKKLWRSKIDKNHYSAGIRQYYKNVHFESEEKLIELHFLPQTLPGYFWIFPLPDNQANVGIGILSSEIQKKSINLKGLFRKILDHHPSISARFENAKALEKPTGFGLPLGSRRSPLSGDRFLLIGDAGSLIDPFTGEGIGYAMTSGRLAADYIFTNWGKTAFFDNQKFDDLIWSKIGSEMHTAYQIQQLLKFPWLFDWVVRKANRNRKVNEILTQMVWIPSERKKLSNPLFYLRLLGKFF